MEVAKEASERYPPRPVYGTVCGLKHHLDDKKGVEALNQLDGQGKRYRKLTKVLFTYLVLFLLRMF